MGSGLCREAGGQMQWSEGPGPKHFLFPNIRAAPCSGCQSGYVICLLFPFESFNFLHTTFDILWFLADERRQACSEKYITPLSTDKIHPRAEFIAGTASFKNKWFWYLQKPYFHICSLKSGGYILNKALVVINHWLKNSWQRLSEHSGLGATGVSTLPT